MRTYEFWVYQVQNVTFFRLMVILQSVHHREQLTTTSRNKNGSRTVKCSLVPIQVHFDVISIEITIDTVQSTFQNCRLQQLN